MTKYARLFLGFLELFPWDLLKKLQTNRIIHSSYVWLVIVPVTAKMLYRVESPFSFEIQGRAFSLDLTLPFSWRMFFFSALCFSIGNLIYSFFAPRMIKDFSGFGDFLSSGKTDAHLMAYVDDALKQNAQQEKEREEEYQIILRRFSHGTRPATLSTADPQDETRRQTWKLYEHFRKKNRLLRCLVVVLYAIGFLLFFLVTVENISWVFYEL